MKLIKGFFSMMGDLWSGDWADKCMFFVWIAIIGVVGFLLSIPYLVYLDKEEMKVNHCLPTEQTRPYSWTQITYVGQTPIIIPHDGTERLYTCDDGNRWRAID